MSASFLGDWERVLQEGPSNFRGDAIILAPYDGTTQPSKVPLYTLDIWVQIHDVPDKYTHLVGPLASRVGEVLFIENPSHVFADALENLDISAPTVPTPTDRPRGWQQPSASLSKINADATVSRNQHYGTMATVCTSPEGLFLGASIIVFVGTRNPPTLEALAIREALALAEDLNLQEIDVASDCKMVVDDIKQ
ncbi:F-box/WD-40 repeat-containing protein [Hordeum vulgare]|nr:F-box/WD-40 repeat-containing protein [Hordeum vulgare]